MDLPTGVTQIETKSPNVEKKDYATKQHSRRGGGTLSLYPEAKGGKKNPFGAMGKQKTRNYEDHTCQSGGGFRLFFSEF